MNTVAGEIDAKQVFALGRDPPTPHTHSCAVALPSANAHLSDTLDVPVTSIQGTTSTIPRKVGAQRGAASATVARMDQMGFTASRLPSRTCTTGPISSRFLSMPS
jgi:hypothetical protein